MSGTVSPSSRVRHPMLLAAVIGIAILAATLWMFRTYGRWRTSGGPFVEFEIRLPPGILLPDDKNIDVTFWSQGFGRGCRGIEVRRVIDQPEIAGRCSFIPASMERALSVRLSRYAEGYWKVPLGRSADGDPAFGPWQRIEFTRAPVGDKEVSSLPHGEYYIRYLVRP
jgi:hypothetical protein